MTPVLTYSSLDLNNLVSELCSRSTGTLIPDQVYDDWNSSMQIPTNFPGSFGFFPTTLRDQPFREKGSYRGASRRENRKSHRGGRWSLPREFLGCSQDILRPGREIPYLDACLRYFLAGSGPELNYRFRITTFGVLSLMNKLNWIPNLLK
ncbi:hypothetical protein K0M31_019542 [Melipona bicolor]|uniref:Uncharacterized protein n=1 Tax=Melipona bicolor TaxID=60889 RepID=A0AA40G2Y9_9HYME|nr:hypothetical protein K0M31_019542 [Melipona bicolor]